VYIHLNFYIESRAVTETIRVEIIVFRIICKRLTGVIPYFSGRVRFLIFWWATIQIKEKVLTGVDKPDSL